MEERSHITLDNITQPSFSNHLCSVVNVLTTGASKTADKMTTGLQSAATPYDKPMDYKHRKILKECRQALVKDMEPEEVLRQMIDPHLFTEEEKDRILANNLTRQQQSERLLDIVPRKGAGAYKVFRDTMKKVHRPLLIIFIEAGK